MESPDQNRNMSGSSSHTPFTLDVLIMLHQARVQQISTCIDQHMENNSCICVNALERNNSWGAFPDSLYFLKFQKTGESSSYKSTVPCLRPHILSEIKKVQVKSLTWFFNRHSSCHACTFVWNVHKVVCIHGNSYLTVVDQKRQAIHLD